MAGSMTAWANGVAAEGGSGALDWLIVGGGLHGVHLAACLIGRGGVPRERLRILDPGAALLERWRECTAITGMSHLRSPSVHHLDLHPWSLQNFAGKRKNRPAGLFAFPYDRPALSLFDAHCDQVLDEYGLRALHLRDRAVSCELDCDREGAVVRTAGGAELVAREVVLAIGASDQPHWPAWAPRALPRVQHVFEAGFSGWPEVDAPREVVAVVGGGISAAQVALRLAAEGHAVHLVARHALREHQFDSDPGWVGPKLMQGFAAERDPERRRAMIREARHRGSMPPDVRRALRAAIDDGRIHWHLAEVDGLEQPGTELRLRLAGGDALQVGRVLLATGFSPERPGGALVDELVASASLPCARCGYPIVDRGLRWHPRVRVTGPLAELELGPASRNITGAQRAGERLIASLHSGARDVGVGSDEPGAAQGRAA